ncbi:unnamed protein product [Mytilus coruscus]|uniref:Uncharacterized protein n=1 Tax=Mytilus coruscus TaxID=42192 RepID=A0A6J8D823_MYTCO|nr:unnamed protein product [Mytilus coruscus]
MKGEPVFRGKGLEKSDQLLRRTEASLDSWKTVDKDFQSLAGLTSRSKFISTLQTVLEELNIDFYDVNDTCNDGASGSSSETPLQQPAKKTNTLQTVLEEPNIDSMMLMTLVMMELQVAAQRPPLQTTSKENKVQAQQLMKKFRSCERAAPKKKKEDYVFNQFWDSSHKEWRQLCASSLGFERGMEGTFGGTFRERLYVATLPQCVLRLLAARKINTNRLQNDTEESRQTRLKNDRLKTLLREVEQTNASNEEESIQDDDTDSNPDEDELAVGTKISTRWSDDSFYNAVIISKRKNGYILMGGRKLSVDETSRCYKIQVEMKVFEDI